MKKLFIVTLPIVAIAGFILFNACKSPGNDKNAATANTPSALNTASAGITVPAGFNAAVIADNLGGARHIAVTPQGDIFVKLDRAKNGKGIIVLHDNGDKAEIKSGFGNYGGTGIAIKNGYLYASSNDDIYRYKLSEKNEVIDPANPEKIVTGLVNKRMHDSKSIALDNDGNIYVNIGAYSNICSEFDPKGTGCPILNEAGGIWKFRSDKLNQKQSDGVHFASGLRNVVGLDWNQQNNQLFVMQHGRDQLHDLFPQYFSIHQSALLPAECMYALKEGDNAGWPYLYYDDVKQKTMLGPEYGGDGIKEADPKFIKPVMGYPGHLAPDGLLFYTGSQFPEKYKNGAFIAFHGSWNRAPEPQAGYFVVFQPFKDGKPDGKWEVFADGFAGGPEHTSPGGALHRPCGLAQGADGSLYVSDDQKGTIYKITYKK